MMRLLAAALLLTGCSPTPSPSPSLDAVHLEINTHCGINWSIIEYQGARYRVVARNEAETESPPRGWRDTEIITIIEEDGRLLAIGPDGSERELAPVSPEETPEGCF